MLTKAYLLTKMTPEQKQRLIALRSATAYTQEEVQFMLGIYKENIDQNIKFCNSCGKSIINLKQGLYKWFNQQLEEEAKQAETPVEVKPDKKKTPKSK